MDEAGWNMLFACSQNDCLAVCYCPRHAVIRKKDGIGQSMIWKKTLPIELTGVSAVRRRRWTVRDRPDRCLTTTNDTAECYSWWCS